VSLLSGLADSVIQGITGQSPSDLSAELNAAQQQITLAIETMITLQLVGDFLLFMLVVMAFKNRKGS
jgi:hypothetical protein